MAELGPHLQVIALCSAFWVAVLSFRGDEGARFTLGLGLGAAFAHAGWALLYWERVGEPRALLDPSRGFCVLFVPLGLLLMTPWRGSTQRRSSFLALALRTLPLALATARLGCLAANCCGGATPGFRWLPPVAEMGALCTLHFVASRVRDRYVPALVLSGFALARLLSEPLRAPPPGGDPLVPIPALAIALLVVAAALSRLDSGPVPAECRAGPALPERSTRCRSVGSSRK